MKTTVPALNCRRFELSEFEHHQLWYILPMLVEHYVTIESAAFIRDIRHLAKCLPDRLRSFMVQLPYVLSPISIISGWRVDDVRLGNTPRHWRKENQSEVEREAEFLFALIGSMLGELFTWNSEQDGQLLQDVLPTEADRRSQSNNGSKQPIEWHTEDAFALHRPDYLGLMCLRNNRAVPTTVAPLTDVLSALSQEHIQLLSAPLYQFEIDQAHSQLSNSALRRLSHWPSPFNWCKRIEVELGLVPVLDKRLSHFRIDPYFIDATNPEAEQALQALIKQVDRLLSDVALAPSEICLLDNRQAVHGRRAFRARFNGRDHWLKRLCIKQHSLPSLISVSC